MGYVVGIDASTTATKAVLVDESGAVVGIGASEYGFEVPKPGWTEQSPELWWDGAVAAIRAVLASSGVGGEKVAAVGLTGQMHGLVLLDEADGVLRPAILWNDQRTAVRRWEALADGHPFLATRPRLLESGRCAETRIGRLPVDQVEAYLARRLAPPHDGVAQEADPDAADLRPQLAEVYRALRNAAGTAVRGDELVAHVTGFGDAVLFGVRRCHHLLLLCFPALSVAVVSNYVELRTASRLRCSDTTIRRYVALRVPPARNRHRPAEFSLDHSRPGYTRLFRVGPTCFCCPTNQGTTGVSGVKRQVVQNHDVLPFPYFSCKSTGNGEPTSGLEPLS